MNSSETPSRFVGATARSASRLPRASARPSAPPAPASSKPSTSSDRAIAHRPAPSDARIAISRWRDADRARSMLATLKQAMASSTPTPAKSTSTDVRTWPVSTSRRGVTIRLVFLLNVYVAARRCAMPSISDRAVPIVAPAARRPTTWMKRPSSVFRHGRFRSS